MRSIDVSGLPEPVARALEVAAEMARQAANRAARGEVPPELSLWKGHVIGELRREEIYDRG